MDDLVRAAMLKWPKVPHCRGWLGLDERGDWYMRDEAAQSAGPFPSHKGSRIEHPKLKAFIGRNYVADPTGCWYFQNGPQRVYVELAVAPWVWRLQSGPDSPGAPEIISHTGLPAIFQSAWLDESGRLFLMTDLGLGIVHSQDMIYAAGSVEAGHWGPGEIEFKDLVRRFRFVLSPVKQLEVFPWPEAPLP